MGSARAVSALAEVGVEMFAVLMRACIIAQLRCIEQRGWVLKPRLVRNGVNAAAGEPGAREKEGARLR